MPAPTDGSIAEYCSMADAYAGKLATHIASYGGACLIIDYGRDGPSGDSLQAVANHQPVDVFHQPGDADLSHWVDFSALRRSATSSGARLVGPVTQGDFLQAIGIAQRTEAAAKLADAETRRGLFAAVDRLVSSQQMGSAFKVAMMLPSGTGLPPGFAAAGDQGSTI
jgi:SAM-dependent MidA family methyltransferase